MFVWSESVYACRATATAINIIAKTKKKIKHHDIYTEGEREKKQTLPIRHMISERRLLRQMCTLNIKEKLK